MKRVFAVGIIICLFLTACNVEKQDYSTVIANSPVSDALIPMSPTPVATDNDKDNTATDNSVVNNDTVSDTGSESGQSAGDDETDLLSLDNNDPSASVDPDVPADASGTDNNNNEQQEDDPAGGDNQQTDDTSSTDNNSNSSDGQSSGEDGSESKTVTTKSGSTIVYINDSHSEDIKKAKLIPDTDEEFARLAPSTTMTFKELVGDNGIYEYPEGFPVPGTYRITVDLYHQLVMAFTTDENGDYTIPVRYMLCSSGANSTQSPTGTFKMRNYRVRFALFNNTDSYAQYWSLITGRIYFHSILYSAKDASKYTESYKRLGTNVSHGCIRLTVPDARWIWFNCAPDTVVEIRSGSKKDKDLAEIRDRMILASYPDERIKLKPGKIPMTDTWTIEDVPHDVGFENGSQ